MKSIYSRALIMMMLVALGVALLSGCAEKDEQTLVIAQGVDATMLDPGMHAETPTGNVERQIFDTLIERNAEMDFRAGLAISWDFLNDVTWEIKLREGVKFHDGVTLSATDVAYSINRILDPKNSSPQAANFAAVKEVKVIDEHTLQIITHDPYPVLPARLVGLRVVPKHYVEGVGVDRFRLEPIGSGPYKFVNWVRDEQITLVANEDYWKGKPEIEKVVFKPIPASSTRVMSLLAGEVDIIVNVPPHQISTLEGSSNAGMATVPSARIIYIPFITEREGPISNANVRKALNYAVDVQTIINTILEGKGVESTQTLSMMDFGYHPGLEAYGYDPQKARHMLSQEGYGDGFTLTFTAPSGRYMMDKEVAEAVKSQLEAIGLEVDLRLLEWGVYVDQIMSRTLDTDIWLIGWGSSLFDADGTLCSWFRTGTQTFFYYHMEEEKNAYMDNLLDLGRTTLAPEKREQYYHDALATLHEDAPWITLYQQVDIYGISQRVSWQPRSDETIVVYDVSWR